jgi:NAD(P)-dependent dehydrogenase (short-subunit alcohol dehydrogenase family)
MLDATAALYDLADVEELASSQLLRRVMEPSEIAATIAFCCSVEGATVNGSVVSADGGFGS